MSILLATISAAVTLGLYLPSVTTYISAYRHALDRGHLSSLQSHVEVTTITYGDCVVALYIIDLVFSILLALLLFINGILMLRNSAKAVPLYGLYIRWKIVFAFIGAYAGVAYGNQITRLTRHRGVGSLPQELDFVILLFASLATPLIIRALVRRQVA